MNAGKFKEPVVFKRKTLTSDGMGGNTATLSTILTCYAEVRIPSSKDGVLGGKDIEIRSHLVTIRDSRVAIKQDDLIEWRSQTLIVRTVRPDYNRGIIQFDCVEYVGA